MLIAAIAASGSAQQVPPAAAQNPSPMTESTRRHERLVEHALAGAARTFTGPAGKPVEVFVPDAARGQGTFHLVIHFHGAAWVANQATAAADRRAVTATLNLGTGSGVYHRAFVDAAAFDSLVAGVEREVATATGNPAHAGRITLTGWSAGHGAIRAILLDSAHFARVNDVLLLDGMHTSYVPEGRVLALGGTLDTTNLAAFAAFARAAARGEKRFLVVHSEIFPGTFASTTETADWLLAALGLRREPVLRWGPRGAQQLSEARAGRFALLGFAGNSAPDHVDLLHGMPDFLARLLGR
ncbi:MAG: hypothetical protein U9Q74_03995 [Gemmatimonadota bacterium]|nr:hypothetical protein [Gemmatimonadota bacterium]